jgi:predicted DCC family thiol-disulfide oxidoreductase YuxK
MDKFPIVLFDGVCNLCNGSVLFLIKKDKKNLLRFASLQSSVGQEILQKFNLPTTEFNSFVLVANERVYLRSSAALKTASYLGGLWLFFQIFWIVPKFVRDLVYDFIAKNRYKWFGKKSECMMPTPELKARFLD